MDRRIWVETIVGLFMLLGVGAFAVLSIRVSGLQQFSRNDYYHVSAEFDNIGDLKVRAPVTIAGVRVGEVYSIELNPQTFKAKVVFQLDGHQRQIPLDSTASIFTEGLLGSNYVSLMPGFGEADAKGQQYLHHGSVIAETNSALILENLIGQFLFHLNDNKKQAVEKINETTASAEDSQSKNKINSAIDHTSSQANTSMQMGLNQLSEVNLFTQDHLSKS